MQINDKDQALYDALSEQDRARIEPIISLFEAEAQEPGISFYNPVILYLTTRGQITLGISPRKNYISLYMGSQESLKIFREALPRLGKIKAGVGCLRFRKLEDLDAELLKEIFRQIGSSEHTSNFGF